MPHKGFFCS